MPEWLVWEEVIYKKLCCIFLSNFAVIFSWLFSSPAHRKLIKETGPPSNFCLYQCKAYKLFDESQYMMRLSPSWMTRNWGLSCSSWLLTPVQKDNAERAKEMSWDLHGLSGDGYSPPSPSPGSIIITSTLSTVCFFNMHLPLKSLPRTEDACPQEAVISQLSQVKHKLTGCLQSYYPQEYLQENLHPLASQWT
jgi:hypothetical protein